MAEEPEKPRRIVRRKSEGTLEDTIEQISRDRNQPTSDLQAINRTIEQEMAEGNQPISNLEALENLSREITVDIIDNEIDENPELSELKELLRNPVYTSLSSSKTRTQIIEDYLNSNKGATTINVDFLKNIATSMIQEANEELGGEIFARNGSINAENDARRREGLELGLSQDQQKNDFEDMIKSLITSSAQANIYADIMNSKYFDPNDKERMNRIAKNIDLGIDDVEAMYAEIDNCLVYTNIESDEEIEFIQTGINLSASSDINEQQRLLEKIKEQLEKGEDWAEKYAENIVDENGDITIVSVKIFAADWVDQRNFEDMATEYLQFADKGHMAFKDLGITKKDSENPEKQEDIYGIEDKKKLLKLLWRANDKNNARTTKWAKTLVDKFGLNDDLLENGEISDEYIKNMYRSLLDEYTSGEKLEELLNNSDYSILNREATEKNFKNISEAISDERKKGISNKDYGTPEKIRKIRAIMESSRKFQEMEKNISEDEKNNAKIVEENAQDLEIFEQFDRIDFSKEENRLKFLLEYTKFKEGNESDKKNLTEKDNNGKQVLVMEKYMRYRRKHFGKYIKKYTEINEDLIEKEIKEAEKKSIIEDNDINIKIKDSAAEILKKSENKYITKKISNGKVVDTIKNAEEYTFFKTQKDVELLKLCYELEIKPEEDKDNILAQIKELSKDTKYKDKFKGKITPDKVKEFTADWEEQRNKQDIGIKLLEFYDKSKKGITYDDLTQRDRERLIETLWRANDPRDKESTEIAKRVAMNIGLVKLFDKKGELSDEYIKNIFSSFLEKKVSDQELEDILNRNDYEINGTEKSIEESIQCLEEIRKKMEAVKDMPDFNNFDASQTKERMKEVAERKYKGDLTDAEKAKRGTKLTNTERVIFEKVERLLDFSDEKNQYTLLSMYSNSYALKERAKERKSTREIKYNCLKQKEIIKKYIVMNPQYFGKFIKNGNEVDLDLINAELENQDEKELRKAYKNIRTELRSVTEIEIEIMGKDPENIINPNEQKKVYSGLSFETIAKDTEYAWISEQNDKDLILNCYKLLEAEKRARTKGISEEEKESIEKGKQEIIKKIDILSKDSKYKDNIKRDTEGNVTVEGIVSFRKDWERRKNNQSIDKKMKDFNEEKYSDKKFDDLSKDDKKLLLETLWRATDPQRREKHKDANNLAERFGLVQR